MALSINTNIGMMIARNALRNNGNIAGRSMQRISTGLSINSASDNPSGVAMTQHMTAKIRGTRQATENAQQAFNFLSLRSSADTQAQNIILRLRDLAVRASNDATMTSSDRSALSEEASGLITGLSQINDSITFNGKSVYDISFDTVDGGGSGFYNGGIKTVSINLAANAVAGVTTVRFAWFNGAADFPDANIISPDGTEAFGYLYGTAPGPTVEAYTTGSGAATVNNGAADVHGLGTMDSATSIQYSGYVGANMGTYVEESFVFTDPAPGLWTIVIDNQSATEREYGIFVNEPSVDPVNRDRAWIGPGSAQGENALQIGFYEVSALALGVSADFSTAANARKSIDALDTSLQTLSGRMESDGVYMNILQSIISENEQEVAGISGMRSILSDADMATEISEFTKSRIVTDGNIAMAAQALNLPAQRVLNLLGQQGIGA
jgi:flagellin